MPKPRLVLFDLMGTLLGVESEPVPYWRSIGGALSHAGLCDAERFSEQYARLRPEWHASEREMSLRMRLALFADVPDEMCADVERRLMSDYIERSFVIEGVELMLSEWSAEATLGVVSNFFIPGVPEKLLEHHDLRRFFAFVVDSAEVGCRKPGREIFEVTLGKCKEVALQPHEVLMVGDTWRTDIQGAHGMGFNSAYFCPAGTERCEVPVVQSWDTFRPAA